MNYSSCTVIGRIGRAPEQKQAGNSTVTSFSIAITKKRKGEESTTWFSCSAWGRTGDTIKEHFKQGDAICVTGPISLRQYKGRDGMRTDLELEVKDWSFAGGSQRAEKSPGRGGYTVGGNYQGMDEDPEIPF